MELYPRVKTTIKDEGGVVFHDETRYGLRRLCIACYGKYPDIEVWMGVMDSKANIMTHRYVEKMEAEILFVGYLWIYYKIGR